MKNFRINKNLVIGIGIVLIIILIGAVCLFNKKNNNMNEKLLKEGTYTMYVKINPLVKLTFKETHYECKSDTGKMTVCSENSFKVLDFEMLNNDAKEIYNDLVFKDLTLLDSLILLCDTARDNDIGFESLEITSNYEFDNSDIREKIKDGSKYDTYYNVFVDFKEYLKEDEIIDDYENNPLVTYTVSFDTDGGSTINKIVVRKNDILEEPKKPTKQGYEFVEWQYNNKTFDFKTKITENISLKAIWKKAKDEDIKSTTTSDNTTKDEIISKVLSLKNPAIEPINANVGKNKFKVAPYYINVKITLKGKKSLLDKINESNIKIGVDVSKYKTDMENISGKIEIINPVKDITYSIDKPDIEFNLYLYKYVESTFGKINLNENILVTEWYDVSSYCGSLYVVSNFREVFKEYLNSSQNEMPFLTLVEHDEDVASNTILDSKFNELEKNLIEDKQRANEILTALDNIKNKKYKNINELEYRYNNGKLSYRYNYLIIKDNTINNLREQFYKNNPIESIIKGPSLAKTEGLCGDSSGGEAVLLNESLCQKYNLNCSRW